MKKLLILTVMLASVPALSFSQTAWTVNNVAGWIEAVSGIRSGGNNKEYTITVTSNINIPSSTESTFGSVTGITVTIEGKGTLSLSNNGSLLVIGDKQTVATKDVTLRGRDANNASVVNISSGGIFRMEGKASVTGNKTSKSDDGGVHVNKWGTFTMRDSASVSGNTADSGGGVYVDSKGTFTMQGSASVSGNTSSNSYGGGGGVLNGGTFIMRDNALISGNTTTTRGEGGGVYVGSEGTFTMEGGTILGNTSSYGGGVYVSGYGTFTMEGGTISGNTGGGVDMGVDGTFTMQGNASVSGNTGDGVRNYKTFTMRGNASVSGNTDHGVYNSGTFTMEDSASVSGNTSTGVRVRGYGTFTMRDNASISGNTGGGVYVYEPEKYPISGNARFTMEGGTISGNTSSYGGGVYVGFLGTFTMQGGTISGNTSYYLGGGVYVGSGGTFTKTGGTIYGDDADQNLKNTVISRLGHAMYDLKNKGWRNITAGSTMNSDSYGFWLNDGDVVMFPSGFMGIYKRSNFNNTLTIAENIVKSSSRDFWWILQSVSGNAYTLKRADAANTMTITIKLDGNNLVISGDSGNGENNWNGTWQKTHKFNR